MLAELQCFPCQSRRNIVPLSDSKPTLTTNCYRRIWRECCDTRRSVVGAPLQEETTGCPDRFRRERARGQPWPARLGRNQPATFSVGGLTRTDCGASTTKKPPRTILRCEAGGFPFHPLGNGIEASRRVSDRTTQSRGLVLGNARVHGNHMKWETYEWPTFKPPRASRSRASPVSKWAVDLIVA